MNKVNLKVMKWKNKLEKHRNSCSFMIGWFFLFIVVKCVWIFFHLVSCLIAGNLKWEGFSARIRQNVHANVRSVSRPSICWKSEYLSHLRLNLRLFCFGWFDFWCSCPVRSPFYCTMDLALQSYEERSCHCGGMCSGKLGRRLDLVEAKVLSLESL